MSVHDRHEAHLEKEYHKAHEEPPPCDKCGEDFEYCEPKRFRLPTWPEGREELRHPSCCPSLLYVNAYSVTRHFGGPEEGGWWWNHGEAIACIPIEPTDDPVPHIAHLNRVLAHVQEGDIYSVLGGSQLDIRLQERPARDWPEETPHYE